MMTEQTLSFQYQGDKNSVNMTSFSGLPLYLEMIVASGLSKAIRQNRQVKQQGWSDEQLLVALILLNLAGGDCVDDIDRLEADQGMRALLLRLETCGMSRKERRVYEQRFRKSKQRSFPSPGAIRRFLSRFHNKEAEAKRVPHEAFIPKQNKELKRLLNLNQVLLDFAQQRHPSKVATLDQDATLSKTHKRTAQFCYQHDKAYQPFNTYWAEQGLMVHSEFRDGNVPASFEQLRLLKEALNQLPKGVEKVRLRSDSAGYQEDLLRYCAEKKNKRFGVIEFAVSCPVTQSFKEAVAEAKESAWKPIYKEEKDGMHIQTNQEWAEVCYVPTWTARSKKAPTYRYIAIRERLVFHQLDLEGMERTLPFPVMDLEEVSYKIHGVVTNRRLPGSELIQWHRERCGSSEKAHSVEKSDLAGGQFPSNLFGANAAWWQIMILAFNLNRLMQLLVLPEHLKQKRMKGLRFHLICLPGRVISHARYCIIKVCSSERALGLLTFIRQKLAALFRPEGAYDTG